MNTMDNMDILYTWTIIHFCIYQWMNEHGELRTMIDEGKDKLEWYRQVDPEKLNTLKQLMLEDNYKENMPALIRTLYEFAFSTYSGLSHFPISQ